MHLEIGYFVKLVAIANRLGIADWDLSATVALAVDSITPTSHLVPRIS